jgi:hypothetical protein
MQLTENILSIDLVKDKVSLEPLGLAQPHADLIEKICQKIITLYKTTKRKKYKNLRMVISKTENQLKRNEVFCTFVFSDSGKQSSVLNIFCHETSTALEIFLDNAATNKVEESVCNIDSATFDLCVEYFFQTQ